MGEASQRAAHSRPVSGRDFAASAMECAGPDACLSHLFLPIGPNVLITGDASPANMDWLRARYGSAVRIINCPPRVVLAAIERKFRDVFQLRAVEGLAASEPQFSASTVITRGQSAVLAASMALVFILLFAAPQMSGVALAGICGVLFIANAAFRAVLWWIGAEELQQVPVLLGEDAELPIYSVLVPLYREANVMPALMRALRTLDYPGIR